MRRVRTPRPIRQASHPGFGIPTPPAIHRLAGHPVAIRDFSHAVCRHFKTSATLTAGFDTRLVLASVREDLDQCEFFTVTAP